MKYVKNIMLLTGTMGIALVFGSGNAIPNKSMQHNTQKEFIMRDGYPVNENGETYGAMKKESLIDPDLQLTYTGDYIKKSDMDDNVQTLEDAIAQNERNKSGRKIPLYKKDGKTIVGEFYIGGR